jgi:tetratricopeptide (TPR) repeat protein
MRPVPALTRLALAVPLLIAAAVGLPAVADDDAKTMAAQGIALYDAGDYEGARRLFEELDARGVASGPILYRLAYCLGRTGDATRGRAVETRAIDLLKTEYAARPDLEVAFYLSNAFRNQRRLAESRAAAKAETDRQEAGDAPTPRTGVELFRVAKLYADQNREDRAQEWYRKALAAFAEGPSDQPTYVRWSRRYLGDVAFAKADFARAEKEYTALVQYGGVEPLDFDRLATARARLGRYGPAADAWREAELLDPPNGDRPRYCWRLARMAEKLETLPERDGAGTEFRSMSREQLESTMKAQADVVRNAVAEVTAEGTTTPDRRAELQRDVDAAKAVFTAAGLEYAVRNLPIRETAFMGGYAPLIFHQSRWKLPQE